MKFDYNLICKEALAKYAILDASTIGNFSLPKNLPGASKSPIVQQAKLNQSTKAQSPQKPVSVKPPTMPQVKLGQVDNYLDVPTSSVQAPFAQPMHPSPTEVQARKRKILLSLLAAGALTGVAGAGAYAYSRRNPSGGFNTNIDNIHMNISKPNSMQPSIMPAME